jgi:glycosyltransferase involved in cell wall biosynthesis
MSRVVLYHPHSSWSGTGRVALELARGLQARGHQVRLACPGGSDTGQAVAAMGVPLLHAERYGTWVAEAERLASALREESADAVIVSDDRDQFVASWAVRRIGTGAVFRRMRTGVPTPSGMRVRVATKLAPTWYVHTSTADARAAGPAAGVRGRIVADIAVDPAFYARVTPATIAGRGPLIALISDLDSARATAAAIRAVASVRARGEAVRLLLLGTLPDANEVRVHATAVGLGTHAAIVGDSLDRAPLLAAADVVWVVADHDDGGIGVLEAQALGRPVLVARGTMGERYVQHARSGLVVEREDAFASAGVLTELFAMPETLARLGTAGLEDVAARKALAGSVDAFANVLGEMRSVAAA